MKKGTKKKDKMNTKKAMAITKDLDIVRSQEYEELALKGIEGYKALMQALLNSASTSLVINAARTLGYVECLGLLKLIDPQTVDELNKHTLDMLALRQEQLRNTK